MRLFLITAALSFFAVAATSPPGLLVKVFASFGGRAADEKRKQ
jgi:hypothetical protein